MGTRFTQEEADNWTLPLPQLMIHIEIDPEEIGRNYQPSVAVVGDARESMLQIHNLLSDLLPEKSASRFLKYLLAALGPVVRFSVRFQRAYHEIRRAPSGFRSPSSGNRSRIFRTAPDFRGGISEINEVILGGGPPKVLTSNYEIVFFSKGGKRLDKHRRNFAEGEKNCPFGGSDVKL